MLLRFVLALAFVLTLGASVPAATLRFVTYNIEADTGGYTGPRPGLDVVLEAIGMQNVGGIRQPLDVLALQETTSNTTTIAPLVTTLNSFYGTNLYASSPYQGTQRGAATSGNGPNALIYNTKTLILLESLGVPNTPTPTSGGAPRQVIRYKFRPVSGTADNDFYLYVTHSKSSVGSTPALNMAARDLEAQRIREDAATLPAGSSIVFTGDWNVEGSTEAGYQTLTSTSRFSGLNPGIDPLNNAPQDNTQTWNVAAYAPIMTHSPVQLRYRDDIQFMTPPVFGNTAPLGLHYLPGSHRTFGNNGTTSLNARTDLATNTACDNVQGSITPASARSALTTASDHFPVVADYSIATLFSGWKATRFSAGELADPAVSGELADPDRDGLPNILEYATHLEPRVADPSSALPATGETTITGARYLTVTYIKVNAATDVTYAVQATSDPAAWSNDPTGTVAVSTVDNPDGLTQTIVIRDTTPIAPGTARFLRLKVTAP